MSRSGYVDDLDNWTQIKWRGQVASAIRGKRGQKLLTDLLQALDVMPKKELIAHDLITDQGEVCGLGALGLFRGLDMSQLDPTEPDDVAAAFNAAHQLVREIVYHNDEYELNETPEARWKRVRAWVASKIIKVDNAAA